MVKKNLSINHKGLSKNLKHGTDHNETTTKMEAPDNMITAINNKINYLEREKIKKKYTPGLYIKSTPNTQLYKDNGCGVGQIKMNETLEMFYHFEDEGEITIGNFGIGLKQMLINLTNDKEVVFILSKNLFSDYSSKIITMDDGILKEDDCSYLLANNDKFRKLMDKYIEDTGFLILIIKEDVYEEWKSDNDITYYIKLFEDKMNENNGIKPEIEKPEIEDKEDWSQSYDIGYYDAYNNIKYDIKGYDPNGYDEGYNDGRREREKYEPKEDENYLKALQTLYQDIPDNYELIFNDEKVEPNKFITNDYIEMFKTYIIEDKCNKIIHKDELDENDHIIAELVYYKSSKSNTSKNR